MVGPLRALRELLKRRRKGGQRFLTVASGMVNIPLTIFWETLAYRTFAWFLSVRWEWLFLGEVSNDMLLPCRPSISE